MKKEIRELGPPSPVVMSQVTVIGWAEQKKVLKIVRKTERRAELWPFPHNPGYHGYTQQHYYQQHHQSNPITYYSTPQPCSSYNYYKHDYNGPGHGYYYRPAHSAIFDECTGAMFNDDNPNTCSIM